MMHSRDQRRNGPMHAQPVRPVVAAIGLLCLGLLTGCDMIGDVFAKSKTPIPGDRVAVLSDGSVSDRIGAEVFWPESADSESDPV